MQGHARQPRRIRQGLLRRHAGNPRLSLAVSQMADIVLALNAGSSTIKYALYRIGEGVEEELSAEMLELGAATPASILEQVFEQVATLSVGEPTLIGHRVVHAVRCSRHRQKSTHSRS